MLYQTLINFPKLPHPSSQMQQHYDSSISNNQKAYVQNEQRQI